MLLLNLEHETTYIDENSKNEMQGPKHVRVLLGSIESHHTKIVLEKTLLHVYHDFAYDFLKFSSMYIGVQSLIYAFVESHKKFDEIFDESIPMTDCTTLDSFISQEKIDLNELLNTLE